MSDYFKGCSDGLCLIICWTDVRLTAVKCEPATVQLIDGRRVELTLVASPRKGQEPIGVQAFCPALCLSLGAWSACCADSLKSQRTPPNSGEAGLRPSYARRGAVDLQMRSSVLRSAFFREELFFPAQDDTCLTERLQIAAFFAIPPDVGEGLHADTGVDSSQTLGFSPSRLMPAQDRPDRVNCARV